MYLLLADIHGDVEAVEKIVENLKKKKVQLFTALIAGDVTSGEGRKTVEAIVKELKNIVPRIYAVPGNWDGEKARKALEKLEISVDGRALLLKEFYLVGWEGAKLIKANSDYFMAYEPLDELLEKIPPERTILLTHVPPFDTSADKLWTSEHVGSVFLRNTIEEFQPAFVVCGHIHEGRSVSKVGRTVVINPGAATEGYFAILEPEKGRIFMAEKFGKNITEFSQKSL